MASSRRIRARARSVTFDNHRSDGTATVMSESVKARITAVRFTPNKQTRQDGGNTTLCANKRLVHCNNKLTKSLRQRLRAASVHKLSRGEGGPFFNLSTGQWPLLRDSSSL
jgi:hypothetical protein